MRDNPAVDITDEVIRRLNQLSPGPFAQQLAGLSEQGKKGAVSGKKPPLNPSTS